MQHEKIDGNLPATGGHAGTNCMRLAVTQVQFVCLHSLGSWGATLACGVGGGDPIKKKGQILW
jgi:hypothetical protein